MTNNTYPVLALDEGMVERAVAAVMSAASGVSAEAYVRIVLEAALASAWQEGYWRGVEDERTTSPSNPRQ